MSKKIGIVVPTIGTRPEFLPQALKSIRDAGDAYILLVAPKTFDPTPYQHLINQFEVEPAPSLPAAINHGINKLPEGIEYVNWLGDDDLLMPGSISKTANVLSNNPKIGLVFGKCDYIDPAGKLIWTNQSGPWAVPLLRVGPDLIPQPGALFRRSLFNEVGQLDTNYSWAFDFDLFIKLTKHHKARYLNESLASFRWHPNSLSVLQRKASVNEASQVRKSHLPRFIRRISTLWELPVQKATYSAGLRLSNKSID